MKFSNKSNNWVVKWILIEDNTEDTKLLVKKNIINNFNKNIIKNLLLLSKLKINSNNNKKEEEEDLH